MSILFLFPNKLKQFVGKWEVPLGKDTSEIVVFKSLQGGDGLSVYGRWVEKGNVFIESY